MKFKTLLLTLAVTGAILWVWHVLTPAQPSPTEDIRTEEIRRELRNSRKKRVGLNLEAPTGSSYHQLAAKVAQRPRPVTPVLAEKDLVMELDSPRLPEVVAGEVISTIVDLDKSVTEKLVEAKVEQEDETLRIDLVNGVINGRMLGEGLVTIDFDVMPDLAAVDDETILALYVQELAEIEGLSFDDLGYRVTGN